MAIVYTHTRKDTSQVFYVGIGKQDKRAYSTNRRNKHWLNIIAKTDYTVTITHKDIIWEEACSIEKYLIAFYGRKTDGGPLTNITEGGDGVLGLKHSEESIRLNRERNIGRKHTHETKIKMSNSRKGVPISESAKIKIGAFHKNRKRTEDTRIKLIKSHTGIKMPVFSDSHKNNLSIAAKKRIYTEADIEKMKDVWKVRKFKAIQNEQA